MSRFQCIECEHEHGTATGCPRCQVQRAQVEICGSHGARHVHRCPRLPHPHPVPVRYLTSRKGETLMASAAIFAAVFAALYAAHTVGDHWVQTHNQACGKGAGLVTATPADLAAIDRTATYGHAVKAGEDR